MAEVPLRMPKLSMTMEEGEFATWHVKEGDEISKGDPIATVMTDKVEMDVESPVDGKVTRLTASEGDVIAVGDPMGYVEASGDAGLGDLDDLLG